MATHPLEKGNVTNRKCHKETENVTEKQKVSQRNRKYHGENIFPLSLWERAGVRAFQFPTTRNLSVTTLSTQREQKPNASRQAACDTLFPTKM